MTRLGGEEAQLDNEAQSRHDYIRYGQIEQPQFRHDTPGVIRAWGIIAGLFWLLLLVFSWLLRVGLCWGESEYFISTECSVARGFAWLAMIAPFLIGVALAGVELWRRTTLTQSEALRTRITRDRYSNPIDAAAIIEKTQAQLWNELLLATKAELEMAPYKQLPAGLDSLSLSSSSKSDTLGAAAPQLAEQLQATPVSEWLGWLDERPHLLLAAETGGGKTTTTKVILAHRIANGEKVFLIDPHSSDWLGVPSVGGGEDWNEVTAALGSVAEEYRARLEAREAYLAETGKELDRSHFERLTVLLDEANNTQGALDNGPRGKVTPWKEFVKVLGSGARKVNISIILLCQSANVEDLGISGGMRQNFTRVALDDRNIKQMVQFEETNPERRKALYAALEGRSYPATVVRGSQVYLLDRTGLDTYPLPSPEEARRAVWDRRGYTSSGDSPASVATVRPQTAEKSQIGTSTNGRTDGRARSDAEKLRSNWHLRDYRLRVLSALRKNGKTRDEARAILTTRGLSFENADWTAAGRLEQGVSE